MSLLNIIFMSLAEIAGDFGWKNFARGSSLSSFTSGTFGYLGVVYFLVKSLRVGNVLYVNGMWDGMSAILESLFAILIMKEGLGAPINYVGLILIIAGTFLLKIGKIPYN